MHHRTWHQTNPVLVSGVGSLPVSFFRPVPGNAWCRWRDVARDGWIVCPTYVGRRMALRFVGWDGMRVRNGSKRGAGDEFLRRALESDDEIGFGYGYG